MSTLVAQTISNGTVSTSSENVIQGSAKAWVNFNGTGTVAIRASYNVSSITDNGTGNYTLNFTNALTDANYAACGTASQQAGGGTGMGIVGANLDSPLQTTTQYKIYTLNTASSAADYPNISISVFR